MKKILVCTNKDYNGASCNRCLLKHDFLEDNPFLKEGDQCDSCDQPLSYEEVVEDKPPINIKKLIKIFLGILGLVIVAGVIYIFTSKKEAPLQSQQPTVQVQPTQQTQPQSEPANAEPEKVAEPVKTEPSAAKPEVKEPVKSKEKVISPTSSANKQTKSFSDGSKYVGEYKNGMLHGFGTYYYGSRQLISKKDMKERYAEAGDYLIGEWYEGNVVSGKLFEKNNTLKEVIIIGR